MFLYLFTHKRQIFQHTHSQNYPHSCYTIPPMKYYPTQSVTIGRRRQCNRDNETVPSWRSAQLHISMCTNVMNQHPYDIYTEGLRQKSQYRDNIVQE